MRNRIPEVYLLEALRRIDEAGLDATAVLDRAGLNAAELRVVTERQYGEVMLGLIRLTNDELLLLGGKKRTPYGTLALMCHSVIHLTTLKKALLRGTMFYNTFFGDIRFKLHLQGEHAIVTLKMEDTAPDPKHVNKEALLSFTHRLSSWLIGQRIPLIEARFAYEAPPHVEHYHQLFHCPLKFNQHSNAIVFNRHYLNYPLMQTEESLRELLRTTPTGLFNLPRNVQALSAQIRAMIGKDFTQDFPDFDDVASRLNMAPQTLRRRLKDEASSYQAIKDNLRRDAAIYYLSRPHLAISEIAEKMGFSEPSTFHRAFKKWTGLTPGEYRQGLGL